MIRLYEKVYSFARPANTDVYASGDLIANSVTAASVVPLSWTFPSNAPSSVPAIRLTFDHPQLTGATFRLHLLNAIPTFVTAGDNSAVATVVATAYTAFWQSYEGTLSQISADGAAGILVPFDGLVLPVRKAPTAAVTTTIYGYLEARGAYPPKSAGVITATLILEV